MPCSTSSEDAVLAVLRLLDTEVDLTSSVGVTTEDGLLDTRCFFGGVPGGGEQARTAIMFQHPTHTEVCPERARSETCIRFFNRLN